MLKPYCESFERQIREFAYYSVIHKESLEVYEQWDRDQVSAQ